MFDGRLPASTFRRGGGAVSSFGFGSGGDASSVEAFIVITIALLGIHYARGSLVSSFSDYLPGSIAANILTADFGLWATAIVAGISLAMHVHQSK